MQLTQNLGRFQTALFLHTFICRTLRQEKVVDLIIVHDLQDDPLSSMQKR